MEKKSIFKTSRWSLLLRGIVLLILGMIMFSNPQSFFATLTMIIGAVLLVDGISMLISLLTADGKKSIPLMLMAGVIILLGLLAFSRPMAVNMFFMCAIGLWLFISAIQTLYIRMLFRLPLLSLLSSVFSMLLGIVLFVVPWTGIAFFGIWLGILFLLSGAFTIIEAVSIWQKAKE